MFRTLSYRVFLLLLTFGLLMTSCDKDKTNDTPDNGGGSGDGGVTTGKTIKNQYVKDYDTWYYFSFEKGKIIGKGSANPEAGDDAAWKARNDWDIAFHRNNIKTNGGLSGDGLAEVMMTTTEDFNSVKDVPEGIYTTDTLYEEFMITPDMPPHFVTSTLNLAMNKWCDYDHDKGAWIMALKNVFVVKTAKGKYVKFQLLNFLNEADESGYISFKYENLNQEGSSNNGGENDSTETFVPAEVKMIKNQYIKDYDTWYYFSFKEGKIIGRGNADPASGDDAAWKERSDWDIAFHRNNVRTNGGLSGNGMGEVMMLRTKDFNSVKTVPENGEYTKDTEYKRFAIKPDMPPVFLTTTLNRAMNKWCDYDHDKGAWVIELKNVFIVKTADGKYAKIKFINFLNDADDTGFISFKYAYQADGSTVFSK